MQTLRFPAPLWESYTLPSGLFAQRPWTLQAAREVLAYGGWFHSNTDFEAGVKKALGLK